MLSPVTQDQVIALAATLQACRIVDQLAHKGVCDQQQFSTCFDALLNQNPSDIWQLYGSRQQLQMGLQHVKLMTIESQQAAQSHSLRYLIGVLHLERQLMKNTIIRDKVAKGIEEVNLAHEQYQFEYETRIAKLAGLYQQTLSTFKFRIQVQGEQRYLQQESVANRIRCMLFAGVRSAVLWRQLGGRRYQLFLNRNKIGSIASQLI